MPRDPFATRAGVPHLGLPYRVLEVTVIVKIECCQCEAGTQLTLINGQVARCPRCGAEYDCGGIRWDRTSSAELGAEPTTPQVAISAGAPSRPLN